MHSPTWGSHMYGRRHAFPSTEGHPRFSSHKSTSVPLHTPPKHLSSMVYSSSSSQGSPSSF